MAANVNQNANLITKYLGVVLDSKYQMIAFDSNDNAYNLGIKTLINITPEQKKGEKALLLSIISKLRGEVISLTRNSEGEKEINRKSNLVFGMAMQKILEDSKDQNVILQQRNLLAEALAHHCQNLTSMSMDKIPLDLSTIQLERELASLSDAALEACRYYWVAIYVNKNAEKAVKSMSGYKDLMSQIDKNVCLRIKQSLYPHPCLKLLIQEQVKRVLKKEILLKTCGIDIERQLSTLMILNDQQQVLCHPTQDDDGLVFETQCLAFQTMIETMLAYASRDKTLTESILADWNQKVELETKEGITTNAFSVVCTKFLSGLNKNILQQKLATIFSVMTQESYVLPSKAVLQALPSLKLNFKLSGLHYILDSQKRISFVSTTSASSCLGDIQFELKVNNALHLDLNAMPHETTLLPHWNSNVSICLRSPDVHASALKEMVIQPLETLGFEVKIAGS